MVVVCRSNQLPVAIEVEEVPLEVGKARPQDQQHGLQAEGACGHCLGTQLSPSAGPTCTPDIALRPTPTIFSKVQPQSLLPSGEQVVPWVHSHSILCNKTAPSTASSLPHTPHHTLAHPTTIMAQLSTTHSHTHWLAYSAAPASPAADSQAAPPLPPAAPHRCHPCCSAPGLH